MAAGWSVVLATARGDITIDRFDCSISSLSRYIGKAGTLAAQVLIPNQAIGDRVAAVAGRAGQLTAYVYNGAELWWGGLVNSTPLKGGGRGGSTMDIAASTFESYPDRREVRADTVWANVEQLETIRTAWTTIQGTADGDLGITVPAVAASGITRSGKTLRTEAKTWGAVIKDFSTAANGFEWIIDCFDDGTGNRDRQLTIGYPKIGRSPFLQVFGYPGSIVDYTLDWDALAGATSFQGRGDAVGALSGNTRQPLITPLGAYDAAGLLANGSLRFDATIDHAGVKLPADLAAATGRDLAVHAGTSAVIDISVKLDGLNQSILGAAFQVQIDDFAFPRKLDGSPGYVSNHRCIGYEIKPEERGTVDEAHLIIEQAA